jgi:sigma-E factor negative regulatory protein RseA
MVNVENLCGEHLMKSQLPEVSSLLDGELEPHELRQILNATVREDGLRNAWDSYVLIGDQLRHESMGMPDLTANVMAKIREEPVVLAPRSLQLTRHNHPLLALAASVAGVAVVGWLALVGTSGPAPLENKLTAVSPAPTFARTSNSQQTQVEPVAVTAAPVRSDMSEYLLAHHTQASTFRLGDNTEKIRTVSMSARPAHP